MSHINKNIEKILFLLVSLVCITLTTMPAFDYEISMKVSSYFLQQPYSIVQKIAVDVVPVATFGLALLFAFYHSQRFEKESKQMIAILCATPVFSAFIVKNIFMRPRPINVFFNNIAFTPALHMHTDSFENYEFSRLQLQQSFVIDYASFISTHTVAAAIPMILLPIIKLHYSNKIYITTKVLLYIAISITAIISILTGRHFVTDVAYAIVFCSIIKYLYYKHIEYCSIQAS